MSHQENSVSFTPLEQRQNLLAHHVRMVARKLNHSLFVFGNQPGLGKSVTINRTFEDEGVEPILVNSHVTPLGLYRLLFHHRDDEVLFFDDCDSMYGSVPHLGLLRSCLWGQPRIVTYHSSMLPKDLPSSFETTSRFVFAANVVPKKNAAFEAVLTRSDVFELKASNEEVIEMMRALSSKGFRGITADEAFEVIDFIESNLQDRQLSLRLLGPALRKYSYAKSEAVDWRPLIASQLKALNSPNKATSKRAQNQLKDFTTIEEAIRLFPNDVQNQQEFWSKSLSKSRASFFRTLAKYRSRTDS